MDCNNVNTGSTETNEIGAEITLPDIEMHLPYLCDLCGKRFEFSASLILHKSAHNNNVKPKRKRKTKKTKSEYAAGEVEENQTVPNLVECIEYSQSSNSPIYLPDEQKEYFQYCSCVVCDQPYLQKIISVDQRQFILNNTDSRCPNCMNSQILIL